MSEKSSFKIQTVTVGPIDTNCYIIFGLDVGTIVIDPGFEAEKILGVCKDTPVTHILLTHGHYDHVSAVDDIRKKTGAKVILHKRDEALYSNAHNMALLFGLQAEVLDSPDILMDDEKLPSSLEHDFQVIYLPGHSSGSVAYLAGKHLFCGDTLFAGSIGRTDLPGGDPYDMEGSLRKLIAFEDDLQVYPGHGSSSTLKKEKESNPFLLELI